MRHGIILTNLGDYADPRKVARLAGVAEEAGWEAVFVWDHLGFAWGVPSGDPWVILCAIATATSRVRLGTAVTPLPRRRPQVVANQAATLDVLSSGRLVLGVGLGGEAREYTAFGEDGDPRTRAAKLDESLQVVSRLLSGKTVTHHGPHYSVDGVALDPPPVQRPRVPIWIGGNSPAARRRAAGWDGWLPVGSDESGALTVRAAELAEQVNEIQALRTDTRPLEVAFICQSHREDRDLRRAYEAAGVTLWLEPLHEYRGSFGEILELAEAGPGW
jgi:probable F420-dependent oxidoreductase